MNSVRELICLIGLIQKGVSLKIFLDDSQFRKSQGDLDIADPGRPYTCFHPLRKHPCNERENIIHRRTEYHV